MQPERLPDGKELYLALCIILSDLCNGAPTQIGISSFSPWGSWVRQLSYLVKDTQLVSGRTRSQNSVWLQSPHFPLYPTDQNKKIATVPVSLISSCPLPPSPSTTDCHVGDFESPLLSFSTGWGNRSHREVIKRNSVGRRKKWNKDLNHELLSASCNYMLFLGFLSNRSLLAEFAGFRSVAANAR